MISDRLQRGCIHILSPLINILAKWGFSPNLFTIGGVVITAMAAAAFIMGYMRWGGLLLLLGGLCDTIDGNLARATHKASPFGALLDSAIDRYAELIMFFGIITRFVLTDKYWTAAIGFIALCGSMMVSYCRARSECLGYNGSVGIMQRPERIVLIGTGALIHPLALAIALWLVAILGNYTAWQRIHHAYRQEARHSDHRINDNRGQLNTNLH
jgi:CDP-diacylglycerol--glycerol-3-phosphate 3-phosphatidyltransferase